MNDQAPAFVRTLVPLVVGYLATRFGFDPSDPAVATLVGLALAYGYYTVCHVVELRYPAFGWLLGIAKAPAYSPQPAPSPGPGEDVQAVVTPDPEAGDVSLIGLLLIVLVALAAFSILR